MALTNFDIEVIFDLKDGVPNFIFTDKNDYAGDGDTLVGGFITVTDPKDEPVYQTPSSPADFLPGQLILDTITIPTTVKDRVIEGTWKFTYLAKTTNNPSGYTVTKSFNYGFCSPDVTIETTLDVFAARFQSRDTTEYAVETISPTIVRIHEVHFPSILQKPHLSSGSELQEILHPNLFTGTHTTKITSDLIYDYTGGILVHTEIEGTKDTDVNADQSLCELYCKIRALKERMDKARCTNPKELILLQERMAQVITNMILVEQATKCGKTDDATKYYKQLEDLLASEGSCSGGCNTCQCDDGEAKQINPFTSSVVGAGTNKWISTTGTPSNAEGNDGDFAITNAGSIYEKITGTWVLIVDLAGADGVDGTSSTWHTGTGLPDVLLGDDSDLYLDTANGDVYQKVLGAWTGPIYNITGATGATGATGPAGPAGPTGSTGKQVGINGVVMYGGTKDEFLTDFPLGVGLVGSDWEGFVYMDGDLHPIDTRGRFSVGYSDLTGDYDDIGKPGGTEKVSLGLNEIPAHEHDPTSDESFTDISIDETSIATAGAGLSIAPGSGFGPLTLPHDHDITDPKHNHNITDKLRGGDGVLEGSVDEHENRPPFWAGAYVIRLF